MTKADIIGMAQGYFGFTTIALGWLGYQVWRMVKKDNHTDELSKHSLSLIEVHRTKAIDAESHAERLQGRLEIVEKERNDFASKVGELSSTVGHLTEKINTLTETCFRLEQENESLQETLAEQALLMGKLIEMNNTMLVGIQELQAQKEGS